MLGVEAHIMEMVCHTRWLANFVLFQGDPEILGRYTRDVECAKQALFTLSKTHSHVESISEVPEAVIATLAEGALYLLAAEAILQHSPPTMHQFLQQTTLQRERSAAQAQLLLLRWLLTADILQIDEMCDMVFESTMQLEDFKSDYDAHCAIADHLAQVEPFFLGAHVVIARGLLLYYCNEQLHGDDVVSHVRLLVPSALPRVPLHTVEDSLLLWMRCVLGLFSQGEEESLQAKIANEVKHVDDLYLHTNDGRILALVIHHYRPDVLDLQSIHLRSPLTVWQRQDNWTCIIRAAESLEIWVGVFADELVAHGFSTLQLHVLRLVQDLFLVLATGAEQEYEAMRHEIEGPGATGRSTPSHTTGGGDDTELEGDTTFVNRSNVDHSMLLHGGGGDAGDSHRGAYETVTVTRASSDGLDDGKDGLHCGARSPRPILTASSTRTAASPGGSSSVPPPQEEVTESQLEITQDDDDIGGEERHNAAAEDYNIVMTGLFLQGIAMPIRRAALPEDTAVLSGKPVAPVDVPQSLEQHGNAPLQSNTALHLSGNAQLSSSAADAVAAQTADEPPRSDSPVATASRSMEMRRNGPHRAANAVASSIAHFRQLRHERAKTALVTRQSTTVIQGSVDHEGVQELLEELQGLASADTTAPPLPHEHVVGAATPEVLREQNHRLRWLLDEQRRKVTDVVTRLKAGIRKQEWKAIVAHLKQHKQQQQQQQQQIAVAPELALLTQQDGRRIDVRTSFAARSTQVSTDQLALSRGVAANANTNTPGAIRVTAAPVGLNESPPHVAAPSAPGVTAAPLPQQQEQQQRSSHEASGRSTHPVAKQSRGGMALEFSIGDLKRTLVRGGGGVSSATVASLGNSEPNSSSVGAPLPSLQLLSLKKLREHRSNSNAQTSDASAVDAGSTTQQDSGAVQHPASRRNSEALDEARSNASVLTTTTTLSSAAPLAIKTKNNKSAIQLALKHVLLTGPLNRTALDSVLKVLADYPDDANYQFLISFKDEFTQQMKGLYLVRGDGVLHRLYGVGPQLAYAGPQPQTEPETIWLQNLPYLYPKFFKFDSGSKKFVSLPSKAVNTAVDGIAFAAAKPKVMSDREKY